ncbi:MAG TPA: aromatic-ring-hydroxylating dioxygenase subunit beta [Burkholderiaceae bacterium]|nr:aromatic-ring-hydroxylating dioxygenase subunit beta [Burkholderiaceae bacterium]
MSTETKGSSRAIPSAGPDMRHLLDQDVVIAGDAARGPTGAQAIEPTHSPRVPHKVGELPAALLAAGAVDLQREVEQLLYRQAELLDAKQWQAWMDLFSDDGIYWMPARAEQTEWESSPSIFIEDKPMMEIRKGRVTHPNAWSQAPLWETNHIVSHVALEEATKDRVIVRSRFHMMELRRDSIRHFGGRYRHTLRRSADGTLKIALQRVDLFNAQAPFDYVIQIWV